jgi:hypothetical protein
MIYCEHNQCRRFVLVNEFEMAEMRREEERKVFE